MLSEPAGDVVWSPHARHVVWKGSGWYSPAAHVIHVLVASSRYEPALQLAASTSDVESCCHI